MASGSITAAPHASRAPSRMAGPWILPIAESRAPIARPALPSRDKPSPPFCRRASTVHGCCHRHPRDRVATADRLPAERYCFNRKRGDKVEPYPGPSADQLLGQRAYKHQPGKVGKEASPAAILYQECREETPPLPLRYCGTVALEGFKRARICELEHEAGNGQQGDGKGKEWHPVRAMSADHCNAGRNGKGHACTQQRVLKGQCPVLWKARKQLQWRNSQCPRGGKARQSTPHREVCQARCAHSPRLNAACGCDDLFRTEIYDPSPPLRRTRLRAMPVAKPIPMPAATSCMPTPMLAPMAVPIAIQVTRGMRAIW